MINNCPFCGSEDVRLVGSSRWCWVRCNYCKIESPSYYGKKRAIKAWNTRPRENELLAMIKRLTACYLTINDAESGRTEALKLIKKYEVENE